MKKNEVLKPGDKVAVVAPGALFNHEKFRVGLRTLRKMGLVPVVSKDIFKKDFIFAGSVDARVKSLRSMLVRKDIRAIWCVRGGYGTYAVAQELAKLKPVGICKPIIGLSDITALHLLFNQKWKWPTVHGPLLERMGSKAQPSREVKILRQTLFDQEFKLRIASGLHVLGRKGESRGLLTGGNLAMVVASLKSRWEIDTEGKVLFLEDIGERAYRIDRMLTQLEWAGKFAKVKAIVFGDFTECGEPDGRQLWKEVLKRHFQKAKFPVLLGLKSGHGNLRLPLPFGVRVRVRTVGRPLFEVVESPFRES